ncbi:MAG: efflux RND transporter permease subunit [Bdellovibrionales bacterium]|nr:efflux RND transporter permease subunit [Bdellovibrionales bacterium]
MERWYASPLRVYLLLGLLAVAGLWAGFGLPTSLFPNSSKPQIGVWVPYGSATAQEFLASYGETLESQLQGLSEGSVETDEVTADYGAAEAYFKVSFKWGAPAKEAEREVRRLVDSIGARMPEEVRNRIGVWAHRSSQGFMAVSFYSRSRGIDELYRALEPVLAPGLGRIPDASEAVLWNPERQEVGVILKPEAMARLQVMPSDISAALTAALSSSSGGSVQLGGRDLPVIVPRAASDLESLRSSLVATPGGGAVHLGDVADVGVRPRTGDRQSFKTSGAASLILFASPRAGGNVRRMGEDVLAAIEAAKPGFPTDVEFRVLVDPSEFIRAAVNNVLHEVALGAFLAVCVLFIFIGSFRNVATAALEIPLSMILAFILMRLSGMNLNIVSLGGLALSAGMNVDASVVVMENIFRRFGLLGASERAALTPALRLKVIGEAVREVRFPVVASTIASLVVFLPLAFTSDLTYAVLGDLAKTVVYSHGLSAIVALLLVPTVRLQLMNRFGDETAHSFFERPLKRLENLYGRALGGFLERVTLRRAAYAGLGAALGLLMAGVLPRLPRELIGMPDTDWIVVSINTQGNSLLRQMESRAEEIEDELLGKFGAEVSYTFNQIQNPNRATLMARLKDKRRMTEVWKSMEAYFTNTPFTRFWVGPWNPAEMPIPDPPDLRVLVRGGSTRDRAAVTELLVERLQTEEPLPRIWSEPFAGRQERVTLTPLPERLHRLRAEGGPSITPAELADLARVATTSRWVGRVPIDEKLTDVVLAFPEGIAQSPEELGALPVGVSGRVLPLKALADLRVAAADPDLYRENQREAFVILGRKNKGDSRALTEKGVRRAEEIVREFGKGGETAKRDVSLVIEDAQKELSLALRQLGAAVGLSILLIFVTMVLQFGGVANALLVLAAVPLGLIGVLLSLWVFGSTLSLNSVLGVILLNGLVVANSILLVDFMKRRVEEGLAPRVAAVQAGRERLRPILITSLTTLLGMLPIALGMGEGGRILQPLGIAVAGGLWVSMALTLFVVPSLQVAYLERTQRRRSGARAAEGVESRSAGNLARALALGGVLMGAGAVARAAAPAPLGFDAALSRIVERHVDRQQAVAKVDAARSAARAAGWHWLPSLDASASHGIRGSDGSSPTLSATRFGLSAEWTLFRFGADEREAAAARLDLEAAEARLAAQTLGAEEEAAEALLAWIALDRQALIQERLVEARRRTLIAARERFERGLIPREEADTVAVDVSNTEARAAAARVAAGEAAARLHSLAGEEGVAAEWPWKARLAAGQDLAAAAPAPWRSEDRPTWRAARAAREAAEARASGANRAHFPALGAELSHSWLQAQPEWTGTLALTLPLFSRGAITAAADARGSELRVAELELDRIQREAPPEWRQAGAAWAIARASAIARESNRELAGRVALSADRRFRSGRADANDLTVDVSRAVEAELLAEEAWHEAHRGFLRLCHARGRSLLTCTSP